MKTKNFTLQWLRLALLVPALAFCTRSSAQICNTFDFSSSTPAWTQVSTGVSVSYGATGKITAAACGSGGPERYVYAGLSGTLSNNWACDFDFTPTAGTGPAHYLVSFTEGGPAPFGAHGAWTWSGTAWISPFNYRQINVIEAYIIAPYGEPCSAGHWKLSAESKVRTGAYGTTTTAVPAWSSCTGIPLPSTALGVTYYARLQRLNATQGMISMFSDAARTVLMGSCCFTIDAGCTGLNAVQSGTITEGSVGRTYSGTVDNIKVGDVVPVIGGPASICASGTGLFTMWNSNPCVSGINGFPGSTGVTWSGATSYSPSSAGVSSTSAPGLHNECTISMSASGWLSCTINYPCGASVTYSTFVVVNPDPTSSITGSTPICSPSAIIVNGTGSTNETSHRWSAVSCTSTGTPTGLWCGYPTWTAGPAGVFNASMSLPCLFTCGQYYKLRLETKNACGTASSEFIFFYACPPAVTVTGPSAICAGSCATLNASGAFSYSWSPSGTCSGGFGCPTNTVCPAATQVYTVTGTSILGCSSSTNYTLTVNSNPTVSLGPDLALCCNTMYTITPVVSGGAAPYSYAWTSVPSAATSMLHCSHGGTHPDLACPAPMMLWTCPTPSPVTFIVTVTDANGCTATDAIDYSNTSCRLAQNEIDNHDEQSAVTIYPNPATKQITVSTIGIPDQLNILDATGRTVISQQPAAEQTQVDVSGLPPGIFFVQIISGENIRMEQLIIEE